MGWQAFHETEVKPSDSELQRFLSYYPLPVLVAGYRRRKLLQAIIDHDGNTVKAFENERIVRMGGEDRNIITYSYTYATYTYATTY